MLIEVHDYVEKDPHADLRVTDYGRRDRWFVNTDSIIAMYEIHRKHPGAIMFWTLYLALADKTKTLMIDEECARNVRNSFSRYAPEPYEAEVN